MSDKTDGLYNKFIVRRSDGSSAPGGKHEFCKYFVLDIMHDKFAGRALLAYAVACSDEYPILAQDLFEMCRATVDLHPRFMKDFQKSFNKKAAANTSPNKRQGGSNRKHKNKNGIVSASRPKRPTK